MYSYSLCGWKVGSTLPLPWLVPDTNVDGKFDILIEESSFSDPDEEILVHKVMLDIYQTRAVVNIPKLVRFSVENGSRILLEISPDANPLEIQPFLLGIGLALLAYQRGVVPLRGSALTKGGNTIAILGSSGAGKSTLTAALLNQGYHFITDDNLLIDPISGFILPTYPVLRIWKDSAEMLEVSTEALPIIRKGMERFGFPVREIFHDQPLSIKAIFLLQSRRLAASPSLTLVKSKEALTRLYDHFYCTLSDRIPGTTIRNFKAFSKLAHGASFFDLIRTNDKAHLNELVALVETALEN